MDENQQGFTGFSAFQCWGLCAPAKTAEPVVTRLNKALNGAIALHDMAAEATPISPSQFGSLLKTEVSKWTQLVRDINLKIE